MSFKNTQRALGDNAKLYPNYMTNHLGSDFRLHLENGLNKVYENYNRLDKENQELREALRKIEKACSDNCEQSYFSIQVECIAHEALNK